MRRRKVETVIMSALIFSILVASFSVHLSRNFLTESPMPSPTIASVAAAAAAAAGLSRHRFHRQNLAIRESLPSSPPPVIESVLFPDWETLVLLPSSLSTAGAGDQRQRNNLSCLFSNGAVSPAVFSGVIPTSGRSTFRCTIPPSVRRRRPFYTPNLIGSDRIQIGAAAAARSDRPPEMIRWTRFAYESLSTDADVIVFAKGVNSRPNANRPASDLRCVFSSSASGAAVASTTATTSAQEVFRCPHPDPLSLLPAKEAIKVSIQIAGDPSPIPSVAAYHPPAAHDRKNRPKKLTCACTMVYNAAKFVREWATYHEAIGVERFVLYDNGSDDDLESAVSRLVADGLDVSTTRWPWPKTQEAGFSHCAAAHRDSCTWMAFLDVDEFLFSPAWSGSPGPNRTMFRSLIIPSRPAAAARNVGQVSVRCLEFGPSGQRAHPRSGVTQGYTCRKRKEERHKSVVRLEAVDPTLVNSVHHFGVGPGWVERWVHLRDGAVNHYKFQAWEEFKVKFRRRVSAYVVDWREAANPGSKDRTPGLGFEPVKPAGWDRGFCEVNDTRIRDASRRWFGSVAPSGEFRLAWE